MKGLKRIATWVLVLAALGGLVWTGVALFWPKQSQVVSAQTGYTQDYTVTKGNITASISPTGAVYAYRQVKLTFNVSGVQLAEVQA